MRAPHQPRLVSKKRANKPARTAGKRHVQKIKESRSNLNIHVREISADAIRRDRVIDDFLIVDRDLGWSEHPPPANDYPPPKDTTQTLRNAI